MYSCYICKEDIQKSKSALSKINMDEIVKKRIAPYLAKDKESKMTIDSMKKQFDALTTSNREMERQIQLGSYQPTSDAAGAEKDLQERIEILVNANSELKKQVELLENARLENNLLTAKIDELEKEKRSRNRFRPVSDGEDQQDNVLDELKETIKDGLINVVEVQKTINESVNNLNLDFREYTRIDQANFTKHSKSLESSLNAFTDENSKKIDKLHEIILKSITARVTTNLYSQQTNRKSAEQLNPTLALTYAQSLAQALTPTEAIRTIKITGETDQATQALINQFKNDNCLAEMPINSVKEKNDGIFVIKCKDEVTATTVENTLKTKYNTAIDVRHPTAKLPQLKITRLSTPITDKDEIKQQLILQNVILRDTEFSVLDVYTVRTQRGTYQNIIIECPLELHTRLVDKKTLVFSIGEARVWEHIEMLSCGKCCEYGHTSKNCKNESRCRKCTEKHETKTSTQDNIQRCVLCVKAMEKGADLNPGHRPSDGRCPIRRQRIEGLKNFIIRN